MSKLSFRARAVDVHKPMPVHIGDGVPPDYEFASVNRAVLEMPTGMEKDEETEHHLQRALTAQQAYGTAEALAIPVPDMDSVGDRFLKLYGQRSGFKVTKQYIHVQPALGLDAEVPDYDMDSEDEQWLNRQVKSLKMEITALKFENMIDRLEKGSGQTVVSLNEAKALLKEDDDLTIAVYDYWLNKRLKLQVSSLIPQVKTERRDGSASNNPYVAFRRRTEKMQTRKNRKNDEVSYEKMLKLKKDLQKSLIILEMLKRREKAKKEQGKLTVEILEKRCQMQDWDGAMLAEAEAKKDSMPRFHPIPAVPPISIREWSSSNLSHNDQPKAAQKKREYRKVKHHKHSHSYLSPPIATPSASSRRVINSSSSIGSPVPSHLPYHTHHFFGPPPHRTTNQNSYEDDLILSSPSQSDQENDTCHPDGAYAFKRRPGCSYLAPRDSPPSKRRKLSEQKESPVLRDPFSDLQHGRNSIHAFHLVSLPRRPEGSRCLGYVRQRVGRGGRTILDRRTTEWDNGLKRLDMYSVDNHDPLSAEYAAYIRSNNIVHYRQSSQSMFGPPQHFETSHTFQGASSTSASFSSKSSLHKPILMCNFDKQVQMLVHLRHSDKLASESSSGDKKSTTAGLNDGSTQGLPHVPGLLQPPKCLNTVGDQKANLVISAIRGLATCKKEPINDSASSKADVMSVVKSNLANGRIGLSTMPAASILQLNFPLASTRPNNKTFSSTGCNPSTAESTSSTTSVVSDSNKTINTIITATSNASQEIVVASSATSAKPLTTTPVKNSVNNGFSSSSTLTPSRTSFTDNGIMSKRFIEGSKQLTVQNLLLSSPSSSLSKQTAKHTYATLSQQRLPNSLKFFHNPIALGLTSPENNSSVSLISNASPSSSAPYLSQKLQQSKTPSAIKGSHQVLVRASVGAACSVEKPSRDLESTQSSEDKNKTFAMEVT